MKLYHPGTVLFEQYEIINVFRGAMGIIYAVINLDRKTYFEPQFLCLKTYMPGFISDESLAKELFVKEIETWMLLGKYDLILNAYDIAFLDERPYVILQYADFGTLYDLKYKNYDPISNLKDQAWSLALLWQFAAGLKKIYNSINRCHGDLHLGNVFLTKGGMLLKIGDFGLTALRQQSELGNIRNEKTNIVKIIWFLLTGLDQNHSNIKASNQFNMIPDVYRQIISDYINSDNAPLSSLIDNHLNLHRDYVYFKIGIMPLLPEEHHANVMNERKKQVSNLFGKIGGKVTEVKHIQQPIDYFNESKALYWAGNKEESLNRYLIFLKYYKKLSNQINE
jgi:hypothetical protein